MLLKDLSFTVDSDPSVGVCSPAIGYYYFSVLNTGNISLTFQLEVDIDGMP